MLHFCAMRACCMCTCISLCIIIMHTATAQIIVHTTKLNMLAHIFADIQNFHHRRMIGIFGNIDFGKVSICSAYIVHV